jgi:hypothetical protein
MRRRFATLLYILPPVIAFGCVGEKEKLQKAANPEAFETGALPSDATRLDTDFDQKITLLGYRISSRGPARPGQRISYTLYWQLNKPLPSKGWGVFTHVLDSSKRRILNIDKVGPMREANLTPNDWKPGKIYVDDQFFVVPNDVAGDSILVSTGVWRGEERLPITTGAQLPDNRALAITFPLKPEAATPPPSDIPTLRVDRLAANTLIKLDGKLDEPAWKTAAETGAFIDVRTGKAATSSAVQGSARLLWDKDALYVGFEVEDKSLTGGFSKTDVDPHLWTKDTVEIMIDPDGDGDNKDYYEIQVNPQNLVFDSQFDDYNAPKGGNNGPYGHQEWSAKLTSAVSLSGTLDKADDVDKGYTVEIKVPWTSFTKAKAAPPALGAEWRINFYAMQDNGGVAWSPILGQGNFHKASRFGRVVFAEKGWQPAGAAVSAAPVVPAAVPAAPGVNGAANNAVVNPAVPVAHPAAVPVAPVVPVSPAKPNVNLGTPAPVAPRPSLQLPIAPVAPPKPATPVAPAAPPKPVTPVAPLKPTTPAANPPGAVAP